MKRGQHITQQKLMLGKWLIIITILLLELFIYTQCRVGYTETGYRISEERHTQKALKEYKDALTVEYERLLSPERIAHIAETALKLKIPDSEQVIYLDM